MYALSRNQIAAMVYDEAKNDWMWIPDDELPEKIEFKFRDLTDTKSIGPVASPNSEHKDEYPTNNQIWQGINNNLYSLHLHLFLFK